MRKKLTRIGNSWGLILPRDILDLLGVSEGEVERAFHHLLSRRERADVYRRLAE